MVEQFYQYTAYISAPPPSRYLAAAADWTAIEESGAGPKTDPLQVSLTRMSGNTVYQPQQLVPYRARPPARKHLLLGAPGSVWQPESRSHPAYQAGRHDGRPVLHRER
jgi:hypothetical protein